MGAQDAFDQERRDRERAQAERMVGTRTAAVMFGEEPQSEPEFPDGLFRKRKKNGAWKTVDAPDLEAPAIDAHAHLQYQENPSLALARAGLNDVGFVCTVVDVFEDGATTFDELRTWERQAAVTMQCLARRC